MAKLKILSFEEALKVTESTKRHLLLGNGFSIAWRGEVFSYGALFDQANLSTLSKPVRQAFAALDTKNFEVVMKVLQDAALLVEAYTKDGAALKKAMLKDAKSLREVLAQAIAHSHPDSPSDVTDKEYVACRRFLKHFDSYYTLSYDLLLYWTLMHEELTPDIQLKHDDGFRMPEDGPKDYVTWEVEKTDGQNVHYLHGALHLFDTGTEIQKYTWSQTGIRLIDQIRSALSSNRFPLFVSEGTSQEKREKILHNGFLHRPYRSFAKIQYALFLYGVSMAENDEHVLHLIETGKTSHLAVGLYEDPKCGYDKNLMDRAQLIAARRNSKRPLKLIFFDAGSAKVWR